MISDEAGSSGAQYGTSQFTSVSGFLGSERERK
jgi:hypothetical protein